MKAGFEVEREFSSSAETDLFTRGLGKMTICGDTVDSSHKAPITKDK